MSYFCIPIDFWNQIFKNRIGYAHRHIITYAYGYAWLVSHRFLLPTERHETAELFNTLCIRNQASKSLSPSVVILWIFKTRHIYLLFNHGYVFNQMFMISLARVQQKVYLTQRQFSGPEPFCYNKYWLVNYVLLWYERITKQMEVSQCHCMRQNSNPGRISFWFNADNNISFHQVKIFLSKILH